MDLTQLANLGEFIGGVAVLLTLIYLALQVRQGNATARAESLRATADGNRQTLIARSDPERMRLLRRAIHDFDALAKNEQAVVDSLLLAFMLPAEATFAARSSLGASRLELHAAGFVAAPGLVSWWGVARTILSRGFVLHIEALATEERVFLNEAVPWFGLDEEELGA